MDTPIRLRVRVARFLSDRFAHRERPNYIPELVVFGLIAVVSVWPMLSLVVAMVMAR